MAIVRTPLGTSQTKSSSGVVINLSGLISTDALIVVAAGDITSVTCKLRVVTVDLESFVKDVSADNAGNVVTDIWSLAQCGASAATATNVAVDWVTTGNAYAAALIKVTGLATSGIFDQSSTSTGSSLTANSGASGTTTVADELLIGGIGWEGPDGDNVGTASNSFTLGERLGTTGGGAAGNITAQEIYRIVSATGAYTAEVVRTANSRDWAAAIATYKGVPAVALPFKQLIANQAVKRLAYY